MLWRVMIFLNQLAAVVDEASNGGGRALAGLETNTLTRVRACVSKYVACVPGKMLSAGSQAMTSNLFFFSGHAQAHCTCDGQMLISNRLMATDEP